MEMKARSIPELADFLWLYAKKRDGGRRTASAFFITGTDTGVGKTFVTCALIREFQRCGISAIGFKPLCCGDREDSLKFWRLSKNRVALNLINPIHLPQPVAPIAQRCPPWAVLIRRIQEAFSRLAISEISVLLVEGAGGLLCPITRQHSMRDLARLLNLPLVIVTQDRLGVLNHSLLTQEAAEAVGLKTLAMVLTRFGKRKDFSQKRNQDVLSSLMTVPIYRV